MVAEEMVGKGKDIYTTDFSEYLPEVLKKDTKIKSIAGTITKELQKVSNNINQVLIYSRINELPEELIDILAFDMHVDWYDYSYPIEVKRNILKSSVTVHKKMGTKYAVEKALRDVYKGSRVEEWFDYGGKPWHFRVVINVDNSPDVEMEKVLKQVDSYKRFSAHLEYVKLERIRKAVVCVQAAKMVHVRVKYAKGVK